MGRLRSLDEPRPQNPHKVEKVFFSEEKNQKTFNSTLLPRSLPCPDRAVHEGIKVFCFFSSEKKTLACLCVVRGRYRSFAGPLRPALAAKSVDGFAWLSFPASCV
jgi:hypothetical protein